MRWRKWNLASLFIPAKDDRIVISPTRKQRRQNDLLVPNSWRVAQWVFSKCSRSNFEQKLTSVCTCFQNINFIRSLLILASASHSLSVLCSSNKEYECGCEKRRTNLCPFLVSSSFHFLAFFPRFGRCSTGRTLDSRHYVSFPVKTRENASWIAGKKQKVVYISSALYMTIRMKEQLLRKWVEKSKKNYFERVRLVYVSFGILYYFFCRNTWNGEKGKHISNSRKSFMRRKWSVLQLRGSIHSECNVVNERHHGKQLKQFCSSGKQ